MTSLADAYDMLEHPAYAPGGEADPLWAWTAPTARAWLREHAIENAEAELTELFVDAALSADAVAQAIPDPWRRQERLQRPTLGEMVPGLAAAIERLGWLMLHLNSNGESPCLLVFIASERHWDTHATLLQLLRASGIPHAYAEQMGAVWRVQAL